jgi:hypothetical protein
MNNGSCIASAGLASAQGKGMSEQPSPKQSAPADFPVTCPAMMLKILLGTNVATTQMYMHVTNQRLREVHGEFHGGNVG